MLLLLAAVVQISCDVNIIADMLLLRFVAMPDYISVAVMTAVCYQQACICMHIHWWTRASCMHSFVWAAVFDC